MVDIVRALLAPGAHWIDEWGKEHQMTASDLRVMTPFNAHLTRLRSALDEAGFPTVPAGTVDKFQGQQAAVSVYSMACSHPDDAPRGMEFLYSLNRLNVASSRARCLAIVICSPRILEPDCQTPGRMRLANALVMFSQSAGARRTR